MMDHRPMNYFNFISILTYRNLLPLFPGMHVSPFIQLRRNYVESSEKLLISKLMHRCKVKLLIGSRSQPSPIIVYCSMNQ